jgi:hypothetical protein
MYEMWAIVREYWVVAYHSIHYILHIRGAKCKLVAVAMGPQCNRGGESGEVCAYIHSGVACEWKSLSFVAEKDTRMLIFRMHVVFQSVERESVSFFQRAGSQ